MKQRQFKFKEMGSYECHDGLLLPRTLRVSERRHLLGSNLRRNLLDFGNCLGANLRRGSAHTVSDPSSFSVYNNAIKREVMSATSIDGLFALERLKNNNNHSWGVPHLGVSLVVLKTRNREPPL